MITIENAAGRQTMRDNDNGDGAADVDAAFGQTLGVIIDSHPDTPARRQAIEMVIATHARVQQLLHTTPWGANEGVGGLWLKYKLH
jgi:hypothetical protein